MRIIKRKNGKGAYDRRSEILVSGNLLMALYKQGVWTDENGCRKKSDNIPQKNQLEEWHTCYRSTQKIKKLDANRPSGKEIQDAVKQVAFMNLNKRGGSQKVNEKVLNDYVEEYKNEIKEKLKFCSQIYII